MTKTNHGGCMKKFTLALASLMLAFLSFKVAAFGEDMPITANVPFEFTVGQQTFPAGAYQVKQIAPETLSLRDGKNVFLFSVITGPNAQFNAFVNPKLKFEHKDGRYA